MIALVVVTDGRGEYLEQSIESLAVEAFDCWIVVDDSGDSEYGAWVDELMQPDIAVHHERRCGLAAAVQSGWRAAMDADADFVFHSEEDFVYGVQPDLPAMALALDRRPTWAQIAMKRQPWSPEEVAAGGFMEMYPEAYRETVTSGLGRFTVHQRCFSLNPCLIPRRIFESGWPDGNEAEQTARLVAQGFEFAYWGGKADPPVVEHIGETRSAGWAL